MKKNENKINNPTRFIGHDIDVKISKQPLLYLV